MKMKTLIIPCAGRGKRMSEFYFPKCLLSVHQRPILFQIIDSWLDYIDEVIIVVNSENRHIIKGYVEEYYQNKKLSIVYCLQEEISGTYFAIKKAMSHAKNKEYVLNWSDVLISKKIDDNNLINIRNKNLIFTTKKKSCRWGFKEGKFINRGPYILENGGVYGIFVINVLDKNFFYSDNIDQGLEVEILSKLNPENFIEIKYENFIDIGDDGKYTFDIRSADEKTRAYGSSNEIKIYDNLIIKTTENPKLKKYEAEWYRNSNFDFIPPIFCYDPLILGKINPAVTVSERLNQEGKGFEEFVISNMFFILKKIHMSKGEVEADEESSYDQYIGKTIKRLERVDFLFSRFNEKRIYINGKEYRNPLEIIKENKLKIKEIFPKKFRFIHGDLQTSNALITKNNKIYVIDPRGYFGDSELFGDPMYDFAKLYYGFCGMWDKFRKGESRFKLLEEGFELFPLIEKETLKRRRDLFFEYAREVDYCTISESKIDLLHAIIWLSVCDYISNDLLSSLYAYLYGTILINEVFKK